MQPEKKSDKKVDEEYKPISSSDEDEPKEATKIEEPKKEETKIEVEPTQPSAWSERFWKRWFYNLVKRLVNKRFQLRLSRPPYLAYFGVLVSVLHAWTFSLEPEGW